MPNVITKAEQITPDWITGIFQNRGIIPDPIFVKDIRCEEVRQTNCTIYHLTVSYSIENGHCAPSRLFLKVPNPDFTRADKEVEFYNKILPFMSVSAENWPFITCYEAAYCAETGQAHFLFDDLSETHFTLDEPMPANPNHRQQLIDAYARLHSFWWEHPRLSQDIALLPTDKTIDGFVEVSQKRFIQLVQDMGEDLHREDQAILKSVAAAWPARRRRRVIEGKGVTLVHRDPHPRNFLYPKEEGGTVKLIDWQSWRVDTGTDDLAYLMACHWPFEARLQVESNLIERYYEQLVNFGVIDYSWDDCLYDYKASIIRCLFFLMVAWSPKQWERIEKGIEAFKHWNCAELLVS